MMNFIDISGWQKGLNLTELFIKNKDLHGVVVKSSGGSSWVQSTCDPWIRILIDLNKPWGFYHYMNDDGKCVSAEKEADFWVDNTINYFKKGVPFADYEDAWTMRQGTKYLKRFLDRVFERTGVKPVVYCSLSVVQSQDFNAIANDGYALWVAQYPNYNPTGFQSKPWQKGSVHPFPFYMMHQYASTGRLNGWNGNLDMNLFYGDINAWDAYAGKTINTPSSIEPVKTTKKADYKVIEKVLNGEFGNNDERKHKLEEAGYDYIETQNKIDEIYKLASIIKPAFDQATKEYWPIVCDIAEKVL